MGKTDLRGKKKQRVEFGKDWETDFSVSLGDAELWSGECGS